ncbi:hypothetical protein, partial [Ruminococcus sp.]|uniref:hypothetical protein n=1 Tax=Ruminococcus sp. TaxID=41978 RepID=UPI003AB78294
MTITLNADYDVTLSTAMLGYVGETNARPVSVEGLTVDGADRYVLTIDYGDGVTYEVDITGGQWTPTADILRSAQTVSCQIAAQIVSLVNRLYPLYMRWGSFTVNMKVNADNGSQWSYNT